MPDFGINVNKAVKSVKYRISLKIPVIRKANGPRTALAILIKIVAGRLTKAKMVAPKREIRIKFLLEKREKSC